MSLKLVPFESLGAPSIVTVAVSVAALKPDIGSELRFLPTPPAFNAPVRGVSVGILLCRLARKN